MPSTTSKGYRIPVPADPVADGAASIGNLAADLDASHDSWYLLGGSLTVTTTTDTDIPSLSQSVTVPSTSAVYLVTLSLDVSHNDATSGIFQASLNVNGATQTGNVFFNAVTMNASRTALSRTWRVTGLAAGARTFKAQAKLTGSGSSYTVQGNSSMTIVRQA